MSQELFETLSLAARYLFALLGALIVVRAFLWILSDRSSRRRQTRGLPWSGMIGEFVVISGDAALPEGMTIAVPWEGTLGSVRSCDVYLPCARVRRQHLSFSFEPGKGLRVRPFSGCEAIVNGTAIHCKSGPDESTLTHGSFLQAGDALLRLRVLAGLDPGAGFNDFPQAAPLPQAQLLPSPQSFAAAPESGVPLESSSIRPSAIGAESGFPLEPSLNQSLGVPMPPVMETPAPSSALPRAAGSAYPSPEDAPGSVSQANLPVPSSSHRRRRSDRWEVDWSE